MTDFVYVFFLKSPTGSPWNLAYSKGDHGYVKLQKAKALEKAGFIRPMQIPAAENIEMDLPLAEDLEKEQREKEDLTTVKGVKALLGTDLSQLKSYCKKHGITFGKNASRPEYFWNKIVKYHKGKK